MKILEILRLSEKEHTQRDIAASIGCAKSTVGEILRRRRDISLDYRQAQSLSSETLQERIYPALKQRQFGKVQPDFAPYSEIQQLRTQGLRKSQVSRALSLNIKTVGKYWLLSPEEVGEVFKRGKHRTKRTDAYEATNPA